MTRRPVLPGAAELFRRTDLPAAQPVTELPTLAAAQASPALRGSAGSPGRSGGNAADEQTGMPLSLVPAVPGDRTEARSGDDLSTLRADLPAPLPAPLPRATRGQSDPGRTKHDEKITVYCSAEELLALETARLTLRGKHSVVADRGRIVREAITVLLADLEEHGDDSVLVRRLRR